ncbi:hypothetical protein EGW08_011612 [Elysia chlorotica]|uniref:Lengsin n=1 Tax=Elysia chlorotica TaxID=188477 RepID=A0A3S0ZLK9_ELYCH|nr:hypothetical protein EGW08_011612 [Elysia chlorotica]
MAAADMNLYDYIQLKVYDIHSYKRGRIITQSQLPSALKNGIGMRHGICFEGLHGPGNPHPSFNSDVKYTNMRMVPILSTLRPCQKSVFGNRKVGSVICELRFPEDMSVDTSSPREATQAVLELLQKEFGLHIKSSFEIEFRIRDAKTQKLLGDRSQWASLASVEKHQDVIIGLFDEMRDMGVKVDTILYERGIGQFEYTLEVTEGIEAADMVAEFRTASHLFLGSKGYDAEFLTCKDTTSNVHNGHHYNISLWNSNGANALINPDKPAELSEFGRHWLAGLIEHAPALTALSSPTVNCYRRINSEWAPNFANWVAENRACTFRVKIEPGRNMYIENRIPSSACNPHLVLAGTVAAGIDGVRRKLPLPEPFVETKRLPATLEETLNELEADTVLTEILGPKLVELYIFTKRSYEIKHFRSFDKISDEDMFLKEKEYYHDSL